MKELTIENKAKRYDEAIEIAKRINDGDGVPCPPGWTASEVIFPELRESDDEKIRKAIIKHLKKMRDNHIIAVCDANVEDCIVWLEKQAEQKPADDIEPKFKVGDWIIDVQDGEILHINKVHDYAYEVTNLKGGIYELSRCSIETCNRLWTIQDAKDGDVLVYKDEISLYKHDIKNCTKQETTFGGFVYHCCYDGRFIIDSLYSLTEQDKMDIHPATKEQRDILFQKMKEAGYEWDAKRKELRTFGKSEEASDHEQKFIWSEKDEAGFGDSLWAIQQARTIAKDENDMGNLWYAETWLKSLKDRFK